MRKLYVSILIALCALLAFSAFAADIDLSGMSLSELNKLQEQITAAMWATEEWEEVSVPDGVYLVGVDIPQGMWMVKCRPDTMVIDVAVVSKLDPTGTTYADYDDILAAENVFSPEYNYGKYAAGHCTAWKVNLFDGDYVIINGDAVFTPPTKTQLGFK